MNYYRNGKKKKKEIMGGRADDEYKRLIGILESYLTSHDVHSVTKAMNAPKENDEIETVPPELRLTWPLIMAAFLLIGLGIFEILLLISLFKKGEPFSFSGGTYIYIIAGVLLLFKKHKTYHGIKGLMGFLLCLVVAFYYVAVYSIVLVLLLADPTVSYEGDLLSKGGFYAVSIPLTVALLNHPTARRGMNYEPTGGYWWTLWLSPKWFAIVLAVGGVLWVLVTGPHIRQNSLGIVVNEFKTSPEIKEKVGEIQSLKLKSMSMFNWTLFTEWDIVEDQKRGTWRARLSYENELVTNMIAYRNPDGSHPWDETEFVEPQAPEICEETGEKSDGIILSTSFENLGSDNPEVITPFENRGENKWAVDNRSRSGRFAVNVIPQGNSPRPIRMSFFSDEKEGPKGVLLSSSCSGPYRPLDVSGYDTVVVEFWRYSTSNSRTEREWTGSIRVKYRTDNDAWQRSETLRGHHKTKPMGWEHTELPFNTTGKSTMEIMFLYDSFLIREKDETVFYLKGC